MTQMAMGANLSLTTPAVRAVLQWTSGDGVPDVDVSALLLDESGQVASDADFVFYNEPAHYSGSVRLAGKTSGAAGELSSDVIDVALASVPPAVQRIVLVGSSDGGTFGQVPGLLLQLLDGTTGAQLAYFEPQAHDETAYVTGEFYLRDGAWKFRAIGQGYDSGLAGLASDYGIDVGEDPGEVSLIEEPAAPAAPPEAPPAAPVLPPLPPLPPLPAPAAEPPAPPEPLSVPEPVAPQPVVSLVKNQRVDLAPTTPSGAPLQRLVFTLGWLPIQKVQYGTDLDASVIVFNAEAKKKAIVWYMHKNEYLGALQHHGDNRGAPGEPGLEQVTLDLTRLPAEAYALLFTINSFRGHTFTDIAQCYVVVQNQDDGTELVRFDLSDTQPSTALLTAMLRRTPDGGWDIKAIGEFYNFRTVKKLVPAAARHVTM